MWKPRILVIGGGAGGIAAAARLLQDGFDDLLVVERADGVGGVWRANGYPGAACDVPSHLYSLSFAPNPEWSKRFASADEILAYLEKTARDFGVTDRLRVNTEVRELRWDEAASVWVATLHDLIEGSDSEHRAHVVITAAGQLSAPADPHIKGLDDFDGPVFHSARWRHDVDLTGKRVAVIGTGASAIQFVPEVVERAAHVDLYQRSAPYIISKSDRGYSRLEKKMFARFPLTLKASRLRQYLWHEVLGTPFVVQPKLMLLPGITFQLRLRKEVRDPALRKRLQPDYTMGCKRLLRSADWYRSITSFNVSVVTDPIERVTPQGVETADGLREADVVILGTGFDATRFLTPMRITGRQGRDLNEDWSDGAHAYLGTAVSGFPNLFLLYGPGTNLGHTSILFMIESQLNWVRDAVRSLRDLGLSWIDVRPEVQSEYDVEFRSASEKTVWETGCTSWYTVNGRNTNNWPGLTYGFHRRTRRLNIADLTTAPVDAPDGEDIAGAAGEPVGVRPAQHAREVTS